MVLCNDNCIPCCDFCIHAMQRLENINGKIVGMGPIGCSLHDDQEHQDIARRCYFCDDYHCFKA